eukprot:TRINITY_DN3503_c0_g1_i1.p2 TRINITY_DN3503_c0_g1~~TRINITY_DN3503_c0_g1_i1.p2  ORF type:complete len:200 (+),score=42.66 TRINITY_DN3503_c0_g1_i1:313-912(+)
MQRVFRRDIVHYGRWLKASTLHWTDSTGKKRTWDCADRATRSGDIDGVAILALLQHPGQEDQVVLVKQYRPPADLMCVEFPAGLADHGERPEECALRELREETGFEGVCTHASPIVFADPGLAGTCFRLVTVMVDGTKEPNRNPQPHPDEGEELEVFTVPLHRLYSTLGDLDKDPQIAVDAKVWHFAYGLQFASQHSIH